MAITVVYDHHFQWENPQKMVIFNSYGNYHIIDVTVMAIYQL